MTLLDWSDSGTANTSVSVSSRGVSFSLSTDASVPKHDISKSAAVDLGWLREVREPGVVSEESLASVIASIQRLIIAQQYFTLNVILSTLLGRAGEIQTPMIIALLRTSFPARNHIASWFRMLREAKAELSRRGRDPAKVLRGLR